MNLNIGARLDQLDINSTFEPQSLGDLAAGQLQQAFQVEIDRLRQQLEARKPSPNLQAA